MKEYLEKIKKLEDTNSEMLAILQNILKEYSIGIVSGIDVLRIKEIIVKIKTT